MAGVVLVPGVVAAVPGGEASCTVRVRNTGSVVDSYTITVLGEPAAWATPMPAVLSLFPGAEGEATISFRPPRSPELAAGPVDFAVRVVATEDPDGSVVEEGVVTVDAYQDIVARITPRTSETKRVARHTVSVENRGNAPLTVDLAATDPDELLAFDLRPAQLTVGPGETGNAMVKVIARKGFARGTEQHRPFQATVAPQPAGMHPPTLLDATLVQRAGLPRFVPALVAAVVVIALAAVLIPSLTKKDGDGTIQLSSTEPTTTVTAPAAEDEEGGGEAEASAGEASAPATTNPPNRQGASSGGNATAGPTGGATPTTAAPTPTTEATAATTPNVAPTAAALPKPKSTLPPLIPSFEGDTDEEIWKINPDGTGKVKLTHGDNAIHEWSVGGKWNYAGTLITYTHAKGPVHAWIMNADGSNPHDATPSSVCPGSCSQPAFSADGKRLGYIRETAAGSNTYDIWQADVDAAGNTSNHRPLVATGANEQYPAFAPDGRLAFQRNVSGTWKIVTFDGTSEKTLASGEHPAWSPNNDRLLYAAAGEIWVIKADGSEAASNVSNASGSSEAWPAWSPDATRVLFATTRWDGGQWNAAIAELNAAIVKQLTGGTGRHWWLGWF